MPPPIDRYLNVKLAYMPSFSSDGCWLAFVSDLTGVPQAWRVPLGDSGRTIAMPEQLTFAEDRVLWLRCSPAPGDRRILIARDRGGDENAQLWLLDPARGEETCLTSGYDSVMHVPGQWSADGHTLLFAANRQHPSHFGIYRQALDGGAAELLWQSDAPGVIGDVAAHPAGDRILFTRMGFSAAHDLMELDLTTGQARALSPADRLARYHYPIYSPDGARVYVVSDLDSDRANLLSYVLAEGAWQTVVGPFYDLEYFSLSPDGRYLAFTINQDGYSRLELLDIERGEAHPGPTLPDGVLGIIDERLAFAPSSNELAFAYTTPRSTSNLYLWNWATMGQSVRPLTHMTQGGIPPDSLVEAELIRYPTFDGRAIPAWLYRPRTAAGPIPVVVNVHGGPEWQARPWFDFLTQYLVACGYAVLVPNVRGSTGYGNAYSHLDDVDKRLDSVNDLAHAAHWLRAQPDFDGRRIAVLGGSYGGYMVLAALAFHPELWAAGVDIVGIANFVTFLQNTSEYRRQHRESEYGRLDADRELLERVSPINAVERMTAPLLVIHGANDPRVPLSEAEQLVARLAALDRMVELLVFDDEGHGIKLLKNKRVAYSAIARFLNEALGAAATEDSAP
ncbi:MAG: S9 family peptidase [Candidatus Promineofilum sp.]|nr:S9 family peptidase [Promineifilum sp.]MCW5862941.1 S9 family peptidase [Anaerolineae bacterium]